MITELKKAKSLLIVNKASPTLFTMKKELLKLADPGKARNYARFFQTHEGGYAEGDLFLGIAVPEQRKLARKYAGIGLDELQELLSSKFHEHRLTGLFILVLKYQKSKDEELVKFYLQNTKQINNWDLVDSSAPYILGQWFLDRDKTRIYQLARSSDLWERRIAILSCFGFIKEKRFDDALKISEILVKDKEDLIHKAVGWMLREIGKREISVEKKFLEKYCRKMPRTMLRYAIEKFPDKEKWIQKK